MREEAWEPSTRANGLPSAPTCNRARASSGRPPAQRSGWAKRTCSRSSNSTSAPSRRCRAGQSNCRAVIAAATGLPGKPKNGLAPRRPKAKGRPGLRNNFQNATSPNSATSGRIQSLSPADTPPVVTTTSQSRANSARARRSASGWSGTTLRSATRAPKRLSRASSRVPLLSQIAPGRRGSATGVSSSPLISKPMRGWRRSGNSATPQLASSPSWAGPRR